MQQSSSIRLMNRHWLLSLCMVLTLFMPCNHANAQLPIGQLLLSMPDSLCPYLDMKQRVVLLEYANQNMKDSVDNIYGGKSAILDKTDNYLSLAVADGFTIELLSDSASYYLIQTACAPICSSIVKQYVANWIFVEEVKPEKPTVFQKATVEDGKIVWIDETPLLLDDEEKKYYLLDR